MSLVVWLPLDGDLRNLGISNVEVTNNGAIVDNSGKIGKCYSFDGTDDKIIISNFSIENTWSYGFWIYSAISNRGWESVLALNTNGGDSDYQLGMYTFPTGNRIQNTANGQYNSHITFTYGQWNHFLGTFDGSLLKTYLNGVLVDTKTITNNLLNRTNLTIGARCRGNHYDCYFQGKLNDVRIYDHCLSAAEVHEIAQGLVLHYKLDGNGFGNRNYLKTIISSGLQVQDCNYNYDINTGTYTLTVTRNVGNFQQIWNTNLVTNVSEILGKQMIISCEDFYTTDPNSDIRIYLYYTPTSIPSTRVYKGQNTVTIPSNATQIGLIIRCDQKCNAPVGTIATFKGIKLESGDKATKWFPAEEDLGIDTTIITDSSGYGHNGKVISELHISNETARYNNSTLFDGVDDCIIVPYNEVCPENIFTINLWFKKDALGSKNYETLFGGPGGFEMDTRDGSATSLSLYMISTRSRKRNLVTELSLNNWYMITMTRDGTKEKYYVNGIFQSEIDAKPMPNGVYRIGAWASNDKQNYYGLISDFRIYCTPLLDSDIKLLYKMGMRVDNLGGVHTFEFEENQSNIFRSELIMPAAKAGRTTGIGEIVEHNGYYAMNIAPEPFYKNISNSVSGILQGQFFPNTSYIFDLWIDVDSVIYNGNNVVGGLYIVFTDGSLNDSFVFIGGNKGWQHKKIITPSNKTIDRLSVRYYVSTDVFYRLDSYICPISSTKIIKQGILDTTNITENSEIASFYKGGSIYSSNFIEM